MGVRDKVLHLDFLAPPVTLNIAGAQGMRTYFGVTLSLMYLASLIYLIYFTIQQYLDTATPTIVQQSSETDSYPKMDFAASHFFPVLYVYKNDLFNVPVEEVPKYFTVRYYKYRSVNNIDSTGTPTVNVSIQSMDVVPCRDLINDDTYWQYYKEYTDTTHFKLLGKKFAMCIKVNSSLTSIEGGGSDPLITLLSYKIMPCSLADTAQCANVSTMKGVAFVLTNPSFGLNYSNYESPVTGYLNVDQIYYINEGLKQKFEAKLFTTEIWDDPGMYFPMRMRKSFNSIDKLVTSSRSRDNNSVTCSWSSVLTTKCSAYMDFNFMSSGRKLTAIRKYIGVLESVSNFGGTNSIFFILFLYINMFYVYMNERDFMTSQVFDFFSQDLFAVKKKEGRCCKKKSRITNGNAVQFGQPHELTPTKNENGKDAFGNDDPNTDPIELDEKALQDVREEAFKIIEKSLDVVTLVKEVNNLKVLTHMLLKEYHLKLVPLIALSLQCKKDKVSVLQSQNSITTNNGLQRSKTIGADLDAEKIDYQTAMELVVDSRFSSLSVDPEHRNVEQKVDAFVYETFSKGDRLFKELLARHGGDKHDLMSSPNPEHRSMGGRDSIINSAKTPATALLARAMGNDKTDKQISAFGRAEKMVPQKTILQKTQTYKPGQSSIQPQNTRKGSEVIPFEIVKPVNDFDFDGESNM